MDRNLQFYDACIVDDYIYFSALEFNGLFRLKKGEIEAEFLGFFPKNSVMQKTQHRKVVIENDALYFMPFHGRKICVYSIGENRISVLQAKDMKDIYFVDVLPLGTDWLMIPCDLNKDFYLLQSQAGNLVRENKLTKTINDVVKLRDNFACDVCGSYISPDNFLYIALSKSNSCLRINLKNYEVEEMKVGLAELDNIFVYQGFLWATSYVENKILRRDLATGHEKIYEMNESAERSCYTVIPCNNDLYILPCLGEKIWKYNKSKDEWEEFINVFDNKDFKRIYDYTLFLGWHVENNILVLYPRSGNGILKVNLDTRETEVVPVLMNEELVHRIAVEYEKETRAVISDIYEKESCVCENEGTFTLTNFISYIQSK